MKRQLTGSFVVLILFMVSCSKFENKRLKAENPAPASRATLVANIPFRTDLLHYFVDQGIRGGVCAQLVVPTSGPRKDRRVIEFSAGNCPSTLVDSAAVSVFQLEFRTFGDSNQYEMDDTLYLERMGIAEWSSFADRDQRTVKQINTLCNNADDQCTFVITNGNFAGIDAF